jgi:putative glutathione S-transferase
VKGVFQAMDQMDAILSKQKYLAGEQLTEADIRAYTTSARFDVAYHGAFKCNVRLLRSYPNINRWLKSIYWSTEYPEFKETTEFQAYKEGYYKFNNPNGVIPLGPIPPIEPLEA